MLVRRKGGLSRDWARASGVEIVWEGEKTVWEGWTALAMHRVPSACSAAVAFALCSLPGHAAAGPSPQGTPTGRGRSRGGPRHFPCPE